MWMSEKKSGGISFPSSFPRPMRGLPPSGLLIEKTKKTSARFGQRRAGVQAERPIASYLAGPEVTLCWVVPAPFTTRGSTCPATSALTSARSVSPA